MADVEIFFFFFKVLVQVTYSVVWVLGARVSERSVLLRFTTPRLHPRRCEWQDLILLCG